MEGFLVFRKSRLDTDCQIDSIIHRVFHDLFFFFFFLPGSPYVLQGSAIIKIGSLSVEIY